MLDRIVSYVSPKAGLHREIAKQKLAMLRANGAISNDARRNASQHSNLGETMRGQVERKQLMWNAMELIENSGIAWKIKECFANYTASHIRIQARTGDKTVNDQYEHYLKDKLGSKMIDYNGNSTFSGLLRIAVGGMIVKGDCGMNVVHRDGTICLQGIEADRIGDPNEFKASNEYIGGIHIRNGLNAAYDIYTREPFSGQYYFDKTLDRFSMDGQENFYFGFNPITFDDRRGRSAFSRMIDNLSYMDKIRAWELQALQWASSQSGVYKTVGGSLPDGLNFDPELSTTDNAGNETKRYTVKPNTITAIGTAEDVTMFQHDRPSPNVLGLWRETKSDISAGVGLSTQMITGVYDASGPGVRAGSVSDRRTIQVWQGITKESFICPPVERLLWIGILKGEIPYHPRWKEYQVIFPPHPTIDAGRDSAAGLNEYSAAVTSGAKLASESGDDIEEIHEECASEAEDLISLSIAVASRITAQTGVSVSWQDVLKTMKKEASAEVAIEKIKKEEDNATTDGATIE